MSKTKQKKPHDVTQCGRRRRRGWRCELWIPVPSGANTNPRLGSLHVFLSASSLCYFLFVCLSLLSCCLSLPFFLLHVSSCLVSGARAVKNSTWVGVHCAHMSPLNFILLYFHVVRSSRTLDLMSGVPFHDRLIQGVLQSIVFACVAEAASVHTASLHNGDLGNLESVRSVRPAAPGRVPAREPAKLSCTKLSHRRRGSRVTGFCTKRMREYESNIARSKPRRGRSSSWHQQKIQTVWRGV